MARASTRSRSCPEHLPNYQTSAAADRGLLGGGRRHARRVGGQGAGFRDQGDAVRVVGWVETRTPTRSRRSGTRSSTCERSRTCGRGRTRSGRWRACATPGAGGPSLLPRARLLLGPHADHHGQRCQGAGRCSGVHARPGQPAADREGGIDFAQDFFGQARPILTVSGQLNVETYCLALSRFTRSARRSGRRTPTPAATWPSSG